MVRVHMLYSIYWIEMMNAAIENLTTTNIDSTTVTTNGISLLPLPELLHQTHEVTSKWRTYEYDASHVSSFHQPSPFITTSGLDDIATQKISNVVSYYEVIVLSSINLTSILIYPNFVVSFTFSISRSKFIL